MKLDKLNQILIPYNKTAVAKELGMSKSLLNHKLKGRSNFTLAQAKAIKATLRLTDDEWREIFLEDE